MARPMDAVLDRMSCRTLLFVLGALAGLSVLRTGIVAGHGGRWGLWLLLSLLLLGALAYAWFYCGRQEITGEKDFANRSSGASTAGGAAAGAASAATGAAVAASAGAAGAASKPKTTHWARSGKASGATSSGGSDRGSARSRADDSAGSGPRATAQSEGSGDIESQHAASSATRLSSAQVSDDRSGGAPGGQAGPGSTDAGTAAASGDGASGRGADKSSTVGSGSERADGSSGRNDKRRDVSAGDPSSGDAEGGRPEVLGAPRGGTADDLKQISGVGPKLEGLLNELGFFHFDQIAAWTSANIAWVDTHLGFKGRIERDDWVEQAKKLSAGQLTEFAERVARGEVESSKDG
ncbi:MAG: hypothetical protein ACR2O4_08485 [Hyphomicrobiaceae bacterium]